MARLIYWCTAGYHILQFWPFWYSDQNPLSCFCFFLPEGSCNYWALWIKAAFALRRGVDHIRGVFGQGFITIPIFPIMRGVCLCAWSASLLTLNAQFCPYRDRQQQRSLIKALRLGWHWIAYIITVRLKVFIYLFLSICLTYSSVAYLNNFNKR